MMMIMVVKYPNLLKEQCPDTKTVCDITSAMTSVWTFNIWNFKVEYVHDEQQLCQWEATIQRQKAIGLVYTCLQ